MRIHSGPISFNPSPVGSDIVIIGTISEGRTFRVLKARKGTKFVILKTPVTPDAMSVEMLRREYELGNTLSHPCIVDTTGFELDTPVGPAILIEYIEGLTLDEFIARGPTLSQRRAVLKDLLDGIDYLHHKGILHNDLKPDNIIINANGAARIIDFGLSASDDSVYKGCIGGSEGYSAPEIILGHGPAGASSDIYSLGLIIRLIFGGGRYSAITAKCCKNDPSKRYQSLASLRTAVSRRDAAPWVVIASAALVGIVSLLAMPAAMDRADMENMQQELKEVADMAARPMAEKEEKEAKVNSLEEEYEKMLDPSFRTTVRKMESQKYMEFEYIVMQEYSGNVYNIIDSLNKCFPMTDSGETAPEVFAICAVFRRQMAVLDSIVKTRPSVTTLPAQEKARMIELVNEGRLPEE